MRLSFPNKEHNDTLIGAGDTSIGAAADNTIVLKSSGVAPHHLRVSVSDSGIVLSVLDEQARTHVNSRPVREKAILRLGDIVSLDTLQFVLKPDSDDSIRTDLPASQSFAPPPPVAVQPGTLNINPAKVLLRGLSGAHFGKTISVNGKLVIGRGTEVDLVLDEPDMALRHAAIENAGEAVFLRDLGSTTGTWINGVPVNDAVLHAGDQIAFGRNRFLLEAPGLRERSEASSAQPHAPNITQTMKAIQLPDDAAGSASNLSRNENGSKNDIWWLIAAAALIAVGLALLFLVKF